MAEEKQERPQLRLRNGAMADVRSALGVLVGLRAMMQIHPDEFRALVAITQGRANEAGAEHVEALKQERYLNPEGQVRQDVADILRSALQWCPDGAVLVNPFNLESEADRAVVERAEQQRTSALRNMIFRPEDDDSPGPSRR